MTIRSALLPLLLVTACASSNEQVDALIAQPAQASTAQTAKPSKEKAEEDPEAKARKAAYKKEDRAHAKDQAAMELRLAEMGVAASLRKSEQAVADAQRELADKERALMLFSNHEQPAKLAEGQLGLDRAMHRRELQQDELNELVSMYEQEDFAELTKELVLKRGRKGLEFAERGLVMEQKKFDLLKTETLTKQERDLKLAIEKAQRGVRAAEEGLTKAKLEGEKKLAAARHALAKLERPMEDEG